MKGTTKSHKWMWVGMLIAVLVLVTNQGASAEKIKIKIGQIAHMTGAYATGLAGMTDGFLDAVEAANKYMDLPPNVEFVPEWVDGGSDTAKSMNAFKILSEGSEPCVVILGNSTPVALALKEWHIKKNIPDVEAGTDDELYKHPSWTFSFPSPYVNELGAWIDFYMEKIWKKKGQNRPPRFSWLTWDLTAGRSMITPKTEAFLKSKGVELVGGEFIPYVPTDVSAQVMRLKENKIDFTYGLMYYNTLMVVMKEMEKQGIIDQVDVGMTYAFQPEPFLKAVGPLARNVYITGLHPVQDKWKESCPRILEMWTKNNRQNLPSPDIYTMIFSKTIVACEAARLAIKEVGPNKTNGQAVYNALQQLKNFDAWGSCMPVTYTEKKRYGMDSVAVMRLNDNRVNVLEKAPTPNLTKYDWK